MISHFIANATAIYQAQIQNGFVWFDNILHVATGIAFTLLLLWILNKKSLQFSTISTVILIIIFVFCLAVIWELIEFGILRLFTSYAYSLNLYSSSVREASFDIVSNVIGGIIILPFAIKRYLK